MSDAPPELDDDLRAEYDETVLRGGVRGKYYAQYRQGTNLVLLEPDVAKAFPDAQKVNEALRLLMGQGQRVRVVVEPLENADKELSREEHAQLWRDWVENGSQGSIEE
jgi:hypothetical protein